jgi:hypothetical protein
MVSNCQSAQDKKAGVCPARLLVESARRRLVPPVRGREAATRLPGSSKPSANSREAHRAQALAGRLVRRAGSWEFVLHTCAHLASSVGGGALAARLSAANKQQRHRPLSFDSFLNFFLLPPTQQPPEFASSKQASVSKPRWTDGVLTAQRPTRPV